MPLFHRNRVEMCKGFGRSMGQRSLRIAIDGRPALWPRTGIGTIARNVLRNISNTGANCRFFAYFDADPGEFGEAVRSTGVQTAFGGSRQKLLWSNTWAPRQLSREQIDVFVTFLEKDVPLLRTRSRIVLMVHDLIPLRFPEVSFRNPAHRLSYSTLLRMAVQRADLVLTNSEYSRSEILSLLNVESWKVRRVSLGAEHSSPASDDSGQVLSRYGLSRPFILALGSSEPRKNNIRVVEAFRLLKHQHPGLRLAIGGSPWRGRQFPTDLLDEQIHLLGYLPDADLQAFLRSAEMLAFPSLHEGFGLPVLEAMSLGTPVVTSNRAALPEVGGDAVLYANANDPADIAEKMDLILSDPALAASLRAKGKQRAGGFRWEHTCAEIVDLCTSLMESRTWQHQPALH